MAKTVTVSEAKNKLGSVEAPKEQQRCKDAFARLESLRARVSTRNRDLTEEQASSLADRLVRDVIDDMVEEGTIIFKRDA